VPSILCRDYSIVTVFPSDTMQASLSEAECRERCAPTWQDVPIEVILDVRNAISCYCRCFLDIEVMERYC